MRLVFLMRFQKHFVFLTIELYDDMILVDVVDIMFPFFLLFLSKQNVAVLLAWCKLHITRVFCVIYISLYYVFYFLCNLCINPLSV